MCRHRTQRWEGPRDTSCSKVNCMREFAEIERNRRQKRIKQKENRKENIENAKMEDIHLDRDGCQRRKVKQGRKQRECKKQCRHKAKKKENEKNYSSEKKTNCEP